MKAELTDLHTLFSRGWEYRVPLYQRSYDWGTNLCQNLVEDFEHLQNEPQAEHYLSSLVLEQGEDLEYLIIDGQQRLTSLILLLEAHGENRMNLLRLRSLISRRCATPF